jgi:hypothetical protein
MLTLIFFIIVLTNCVNNAAEKITVVNSKGEQFAGSSVCQNCHQEIYDSFIHTPHYLTSQPAQKKYIKGNFDEGKNIYMYNYFDKVIMEDRDSGFFQVEYYHDKEKTAHRFDIVIGSGTRGQTYLYWQGNRLFELPVSYFTPLHTWSNSPGYPEYQPFFSRPVSGRCLECHGTYFKKISVESNGKEEYDHKQIIYGVDCERCHGPAQKHVEYQEQHPNDRQGRYVINLANFTRQQKLDMCALCHSGIWKVNKTPFSFIPGDTLTKFLPEGSKPLTDTSNIDVHGNEYGLLISSKCFKMTMTLQCNTCHDTHMNQRGNLSMFSQKCMNCHNNEHQNFCKMAATLGPIIKENCIDCHMPLLPSKVLSVHLEGQENPIPAMIRKHYISIYPDATQKFLHNMK